MKTLLKQMKAAAMLAGSDKDIVCITSARGAYEFPADMVEYLERCARALARALARSGKGSQGVQLRNNISQRRAQAWNALPVEEKERALGVINDLEFLCTLYDCNERGLRRNTETGCWMRVLDDDAMQYFKNRVAKLGTRWCWDEDIPMLWAYHNLDFCKWEYNRSNPAARRRLPDAGWLT